MGGASETARYGRLHRAPETISQAISWETVKNRMLRLGLCERCAAQYAWGTQIGFALSHPPCDACLPIIDQIGHHQRPNGWSTVDHKNLAPPLSPSGKLTPDPERAPSSRITCVRCGAWWTGLAAAHCGNCHLSFTSVSAFDQHRRTGCCLLLADVGLVAADRDWDGWSLPGTWTGPDDEDAA